MDDILHVTVAVPGSKLGAMYAMLGALLGGASMPAIAAAAPAPAKAPAIPTSEANAAEIDTGKDLEAKASDTANGVAENGAAEVDAHGHPWSADMHAATKGTTKEGLWRMKVGVSRPAPMPGFPKTDAAPTAGAPASESGAASAQSTPAATATVEDEDEFAAFRAAADKGNATDAAAAASVPARKWTDADLGALCNQAAVKFGDPAPVKAIIQEFVPADAVPHSRNIPDDKREDFAKAVEAKAEITFAG